MRKGMLLAALLFLVLFVTGSAVSANEGQGPQYDYDTCPRDSMSPEDIERFQVVMDEFRLKMAALRGVAGAFEERLALKIERRDALQEIVPPEFADRYNNFNTEPQRREHRRGASALPGNGQVH